MAAPIAAGLAAWAHGLRLSDVPAPVLHLARLHLLDALGVAMGASSVPSQRRLIDQLVAEAPAPGPATVLGLARGVAPPLAALLNGTSMHSLEYDDTHMQSIVHGSSVIVPAALAAGEAQGLPLDDVLRLVVAGWEVLVRLGEASPGGFQRRGFQVTSVAGVVVAALLASLARGADAARCVQAMGIAGSQAGGIFEFLHDGSSVKALHPGWAAHAGHWAAACAAGGMSGPDTVLEGRFGLFNTYADDAQAGARLRASLASLGTTWKLQEAAFKLHPCCHYIHPFLECVERLLPQLAQRGAGLADVRTVRCEVAPGAAPVICEPWPRKQAPASGREAKHSLPYTLALALLGRPVDLAAMTCEGTDADALSLAQRIEWTPMADTGFPARFDARVELHLADGQLLHERVDQVHGSAERPASETQIRAKFQANAAAVLPPAACTAAWQTVMQGGPMADLQTALRTPRDERGPR